MAATTATTTATTTTTASVSAAAATTTTTSAAAADATAVSSSVSKGRNSGTAKRKDASTADVFPDFDNNASIPLAFCRDDTHSARLFKIDAQGRVLWNDNGYRMSKATHHVAEGTWYWEFTVLELADPANLRVGWSQISGDLNTPCGYDSFSYGYRAHPGGLFHESRERPALSSGGGSVSYADGYAQGDVVGVMIHVPPLSEAEQKLLYARRWDHFKNPQYLPLKEKRPLPYTTGSWIRYFRNGHDLGVAFTDICLGRYYPCVSSYKTGKVKVNFGPEFAFPLTSAAGVQFTQARTNELKDKQQQRNDDSVVVYRPFCDVFDTIPPPPSPPPPPPPPEPVVTAKDEPAPPSAVVLTQEPPVVIKQEPPVVIKQEPPPLPNSQLDSATPPVQSAERPEPAPPLPLLNKRKLSTVAEETELSPKRVRQADAAALLALSSAMFDSDAARSYPAARHQPPPQPPEPVEEEKELI
ncbi:transcription factor, contains a PHD finger motif [Sorochytrium milnesiophthora]